MSRSVMIFSHPNHEVAILGSVRRLQPYLIFLTDGGAQERVDQSKENLKSVVNMADIAWLNVEEASLYEALLKGDVASFRALSGEVGAILSGLDFDRVYCDSIEFYNPLHDVALPITRAALGKRTAPIFEVPLIHQRKADTEVYEVLRSPKSLWADCVNVSLTNEERGAKLRAFDIYTSLAAQLGKENVDLAIARCGEEQFLKARRTLPTPAVDQVLRYEWRGRKLREMGLVEDAITCGDHYVPLVEALCPELMAA
ncbi:hypothetical protein [Parvibaculum sp.]|uniref:hypothetical protein n=1 Tax=Parvibaculum sp. TaxID=2024848 RepID=UPI00320F5DCE